MIRSVANRYYRMSRTLACRTWKGFRRIPKDSKGRGEATMGLYCLRMTRKLEVVTNELANERYTLALVTARLFFFRRLQRLLTVHSRPRGPVHHVFLDAGWGEREGGKGEGGRGEARQFQKSIHEVVHLSIRGTNESVRFADPAASLGFVRNRGTMATMTQTPPLHLFFFSFSSSSSIIVPCLARGESFDDDLDDLDEDEV